MSKQKRTFLDIPRSDVSAFRRKLKSEKKNSRGPYFVKSDPVTVEQLEELMKKSTLLSSDHINAYFSGLNSKYRHIYGLSTYFYTRLVSNGQYDYQAVTRWTKNTCVFAKDLVFVPINLEQVHWILAVIWMKKRRIEFYDSLGTPYKDSEVGRHLVQYLKDEFRCKETGGAYEEDEDGDDTASLKSGQSDKTRFSRVSHHSNHTTKSHNSALSETTQSTRVSSTHSPNGAQGEDLEDFVVEDRAWERGNPQSDGTSCGVFVCLITRLLAEKTDEETMMEIIFGSEAADKYRLVMAMEIYEFAKEPSSGSELEQGSDDRD